ncbi:MAG: aminomethyl-transferring glycine dehydrogenase subunit GcvPA [candidate division WOR-3 bacterium]|uniref:Probable glycine dehydrogenase (decarboxylating) subunit 1 n=1 Tax=candidate division WOR-3 bacterium TaxID=2052148 RepID=A0A7C1NT09_UNCW3|nr:aminomethyl-transferring glycine dehydrogenase subunit GcvPA [candidate division WOR-3 bacterium]
MNYAPHTPEDIRQMLDRIGVKNIDELFDTIPEELKYRHRFNLPRPLSEPEVISELSRLARLNAGTDQLICFAGAGAYDHYRPALIDTIISRSEFYTAYTPYQAEVSQGTLQSIYEFQSLVCRLFEMEVANASMYDCASALAETVHMARDITGRSQVLVSATVNPVYREVIATYAHGLNVPIVAIPDKNLLTDLDRLQKLLNTDTAAVIIQHPNFFGALEPVQEIGRLTHEAGGLLIVAVDPISLGILQPPGAYDADIAVAEGQGLGIPLSLGGPYLGILTAKKKYIRHMPGRIAARTVDVEGRTGYVLALQTREQHIRRERATSNICTNQALCALAATVYLAWMGKEGIKEVARQCLAKATYLATAIAEIPGFKLPTSAPCFKEFVVETPVPAGEIIAAGVQQGILPGVDLGQFNPQWQNRLLVAVTERRTRQELNQYLSFIKQFRSNYGM